MSGPKRAAMLWKEVGIKNLADLKEAAITGKLRTLPGMGEKSESKILAGIEAVARRSQRIPLGKAWHLLEELLALLWNLPGVQQVEIGGSLRRMRSTVGDLDLVAAANDPTLLMDALSARPDIQTVLARGDTKISLEFQHNLRAQLWVFPPERFGTGWVYVTGSKDHNVRLRELALKKHLSLSDQAFFARRWF